MGTLGNRYANGREIRLEDATRWLSEREFLAVYKIAFRELLRADEWRQFRAWPETWRWPTVAFYNVPGYEQQARWFAINLASPTIHNCGLVSRTLLADELDLAYVASLAAWWANLPDAARAEFNRDVEGGACPLWVPVAVEAPRGLYYSYMQADPAYMTLGALEAAPTDPGDPLSARDPQAEVARVTPGGGGGSGFVPMGTVPTSAVPYEPLEPPKASAPPDADVGAAQGDKHPSAGWAMLGWAAVTAVAIGIFAAAASGAGMRNR